MIMTLITIALVVSGCLGEDGDDGTVEPGKLRTYDTFVDLGDAEAVDVNIEMGRGSLKLTPGIDKLMEGTFVYNIGQWKPVFSYEDEGEVWNLTVTQPNADLKVGTGARNEWDVRLLYYVPMAIDVVMGAGTADVKVGGMDLASLSVATGSGDVNLDLTGDWYASVIVRAGTGAGNVDIVVPSSVGVQVSVIQGAGTVIAPGFTEVEGNYKNAAFDTADVLILIATDIGTGDLTVLEI
jgi:hypothetical protein